MRKINIREAKINKDGTYIIAKALVMQDSCRFVSFMTNLVKHFFVTLTAKKYARQLPKFYQI